MNLFTCLILIILVFDGGFSRPAADEGDNNELSKKIAEASRVFENRDEGLTNDGVNTHNDHIGKLEGKIENPNKPLEQTGNARKLSEWNLNRDNILMILKKNGILDREFINGGNYEIGIVNDKDNNVEWIVPKLSYGDNNEFIVNNDEMIGNNNEIIVNNDGANGGMNIIGEGQKYEDGISDDIDGRNNLLLDNFLTNLDDSNLEAFLEDLKIEHVDLITLENLLNKQLKLIESRNKLANNKDEFDDKVRIGNIGPDDDVIIVADVQKFEPDILKDVNSDNGFKLTKYDNHAIIQNEFRPDNLDSIGNSFISNEAKLMGNSFSPNKHKIIANSFISNNDNIIENSFTHNKEKVLGNSLNPNGENLIGNSFIPYKGKSYIPQNEKISENTFIPKNENMIGYSFVPNMEETIGNNSIYNNEKLIGNSLNPNKEKILENGFIPNKENIIGNSFIPQNEKRSGNSFTPQNEKMIGNSFVANMKKTIGNNFISNKEKLIGNSLNPNKEEILWNGFIPNREEIIQSNYIRGNERLNKNIFIPASHVRINNVNSDERNVDNSVNIEDNYKTTKTHLVGTSGTRDATINDDNYKNVELLNPNKCKTLLSDNQASMQESIKNNLEDIQNFVGSSEEVYIKKPRVIYLGKAQNIYEKPFATNNVQKIHSQKFGGNKNNDNRFHNLGGYKNNDNLNIHKDNFVEGNNLNERKSQKLGGYKNNDNLNIHKDKFVNAVLEGNNLNERESQKLGGYKNNDYLNIHKDNFVNAILEGYNLNEREKGIIIEYIQNKLIGNKQFIEELPKKINLIKHNNLDKKPEKYLTPEPARKEICMKEKAGKEIFMKEKAGNNDAHENKLFDNNNFQLGKKAINGSIIKGSNDDNKKQIVSDYSNKRIDFQQHEYMNNIQNRNYNNEVLSDKGFFNKNDQDFKKFNYNLGDYSDNRVIDKNVEDLKEYNYNLNNYKEVLSDRKEIIDEKDEVLKTYNYDSDNYKEVLSDNGIIHKNAEDLKEYNYNLENYKEDLQKFNYNLGDYNDALSDNRFIDKNVEDLKEYNYNLDNKKEVFTDKKEIIDEKDEVLKTYNYDSDNYKEVLSDKGIIHKNAEDLKQYNYNVDDYKEVLNDKKGFIDDKNEVLKKYNYDSDDYKEVVSDKGIINKNVQDLKENNYNLYKYKEVLNDKKGFIDEKDEVFKKYKYDSDNKEDISDKGIIHKNVENLKEYNYNLHNYKEVLSDKEIINKNDEVLKKYSDKKNTNAGYFKYGNDIQNKNYNLGNYNKGFSNKEVVNKDDGVLRKYDYNLDNYKDILDKNDDVKSYDYDLGKYKEVPNDKEIIDKDLKKYVYNLDNKKENNKNEIERNYNYENNILNNNNNLGNSKGGLSDKRGINDNNYEVLKKYDYNSENKTEMNKNERIIERNYNYANNFQNNNNNLDYNEVLSNKEVVNKDDGVLKKYAEDYKEIIHKNDEVKKFNYNLGKEVPNENEIIDKNYNYNYNSGNYKEVPNDKQIIDENDKVLKKYGYNANNKIEININEAIIERKYNYENNIQNNSNYNEILSDKEVINKDGAIKKYDYNLDNYKKIIDKNNEAKKYNYNIGNYEEIPNNKEIIDQNGEVLKNYNHNSDNHKEVPNDKEVTNENNNVLQEYSYNFGNYKEVRGDIGIIGKNDEVVSNYNLDNYKEVRDKEFIDKNDEDYNLVLSDKRIIDKNVEDLKEYNYNLLNYKKVRDNKITDKNDEVIKKFNYISDNNKEIRKNEEIIDNHYNYDSANKKENPSDEEIINKNKISRDYNYNQQDFVDDQEHTLDEDLKQYNYNLVNYKEVRDNKITDKNDEVIKKYNYISDNNKEIRTNEGIIDNHYNHDTANKKENHSDEEIINKNKALRDYNYNQKEFVDDQEHTLKDGYINKPNIIDDYVNQGKENAKELCKNNNKLEKENENFDNINPEGTIFHRHRRDVKLVSSEIKPADPDSNSSTKITEENADIKNESSSGNTAHAGGFKHFPFLRKFPHLFRNILALQPGLNVNTNGISSVSHSNAGDNNKENVYLTDANNNKIIQTNYQRVNNSPNKELQIVHNTENATNVNGADQSGSSLTKDATNITDNRILTPTKFKNIAANIADIPINNRTAAESDLNRAGNQVNISSQIHKLESNLTAQLLDNKLKPDDKQKNASGQDNVDLKLESAASPQANSEHNLESIVIPQNPIFVEAANLGESKHDKLENLGESKLGNLENLGESKLDNLKKLGESKLGNLENLGKSKLDNLGKLGESILDNLDKLGESKLDNLENLGESKLDNLNNLGESKLDNLENLGESKLDNLENLGDSKLDTLANVDKELKSVASLGESKTIPDGKSIDKIITVKAPEVNPLGIGPNYHDTVEAIKGIDINLPNNKHTVEPIKAIDTNLPNSYNNHHILEPIKGVDTNLPNNQHTIEPIKDIDNNLENNQHKVEPIKAIDTNLPNNYNNHHIVEPIKGIDINLPNNEHTVEPIKDIVINLQNNQHTVEPIKAIDTNLPNNYNNHHIIEPIKEININLPNNQLTVEPIKGIDINLPNNNHHTVEASKGMDISELQKVSNQNTSGNNEEVNSLKNNTELNHAHNNESSLAQNVNNNNNNESVVINNDNQNNQHNNKTQIPHQLNSSKHNADIVYNNKKVTSHDDIKKVEDLISSTKDEISTRIKFNLDNMPIIQAPKLNSNVHNINSKTVPYDTFARRFMHMNKNRYNGGGNVPQYVQNKMHVMGRVPFNIMRGFKRIQQIASGDQHNESEEKIPSPQIDLSTHNFNPSLKENANNKDQSILEDSSKVQNGSGEGMASAGTQAQNDKDKSNLNHMPELQDNNKDKIIVKQIPADKNDKLILNHFPEAQNDNKDKLSLNNNPEVQNDNIDKTNKLPIISTHKENAQAESKPHTTSVPLDNVKNNHAYLDPAKIDLIKNSDPSIIERHKRNEFPYLPYTNPLYPASVPSFENGEPIYIPSMSMEYPYSYQNFDKSPQVAIPIHPNLINTDVMDRTFQDAKLHNIKDTDLYYKPLRKSLRERISNRKLNYKQNLLKLSKKHSQYAARNPVNRKIKNIANRYFNTENKPPNENESALRKLNNLRKKHRLKYLRKLQKPFEDVDPIKVLSDSNPDIQDINKVVDNFSLLTKSPVGEEVKPNLSNAKLEDVKENQNTVFENDKMFISNPPEQLKKDVNPFTNKINDYNSSNYHLKGSLEPNITSIPHNIDKYGSYILPDVRLPQNANDARPIDQFPTAKLDFETNSNTRNFNSPAQIIESNRLINSEPQLSEHTNNNRNSISDTQLTGNKLINPEAQLTENINIIHNNSEARLVENINNNPQRTSELKPPALNSPDLTNYTQVVNNENSETKAKNQDVYLQDEFNSTVIQRNTQQINSTRPSNIQNQNTTIYNNSNSAINYNNKSGSIYQVGENFSSPAEKVDVNDRKLSLPTPNSSEIKNFVEMYKNNPSFFHSTINNLINNQNTRLKIQEPAQALGNGDNINNNSNSNTIPSVPASSSNLIPSEPSSSSDVQNILPPSPPQVHNIVIPIENAQSEPPSSQHVQSEFPPPSSDVQNNSIPNNTSTPNVQNNLPLNERENQTKLDVVENNKFNSTAVERVARSNTTQPEVFLKDAANNVIIQNNNQNMGRRFNSKSQRYPFSGIHNNQNSNMAINFGQHSTGIYQQGYRSKNGETIHTKIDYSHPEISIISDLNNYQVNNPYVPNENHLGVAPNIDSGSQHAHSSFAGVDNNLISDRSNHPILSTVLQSPHSTQFKNDVSNNYKIPNQYLRNFQGLGDSLNALHSVYPDNHLLNTEHLLQVPNKVNAHTQNLLHDIQNKLLNTANQFYPAYSGNQEHLLRPAQTGNEHLLHAANPDVFLLDHANNKVIQNNFQNRKPYYYTPMRFSSDYNKNTHAYPSSMYKNIEPTLTEFDGGRVERKKDVGYSINEASTSLHDEHVDGKVNSDVPDPNGLDLVDGQDIIPQPTNLDNVYGKETTANSVELDFDYKQLNDDEHKDVVEHAEVNKSNKDSPIRTNDDHDQALNFRFPLHFDEDFERELHLATMVPDTTNPPPYYVTAAPPAHYDHPVAPTPRHRSSTEAPPVFADRDEQHEFDVFKMIGDPDAVKNEHLHDPIPYYESSAESPLIHQNDFRTASVSDRMIPTATQAPIELEPIKAPIFHTTPSYYNQWQKLYGQLDYPNVATESAGLKPHITYHGAPVHQHIATPAGSIVNITPGGVAHDEIKQVSTIGDINKVTPVTDNDRYLTSDTTNTPLDELLDLENVDLDDRGLIIDLINKKLHKLTQDLLKTTKAAKKLYTMEPNVRKSDKYAVTPTRKKHKHHGTAPCTKTIRVMQTPVYIVQTARPYVYYPQTPKPIIVHKPKPPKSYVHSYYPQYPINTGYSNTIHMNAGNNPYIYVNRGEGPKKKKKCNKDYNKYIDSNRILDPQDNTSVPVQPVNPTNQDPLIDIDLPINILSTVEGGTQSPLQPTQVVGQDGLPIFNILTNNGTHALLSNGIISLTVPINVLSTVTTNTVQNPSIDDKLLVNPNPKNPYVVGQIIPTEILPVISDGIIPTGSQNVQQGTNSPLIDITAPINVISSIQQVGPTNPGQQNNPSLINVVAPLNVISSTTNQEQQSNNQNKGSLVDVVLPLNVLSSITNQEQQIGGQNNGGLVDVLVPLNIASASQASGQHSDQNKASIFNLEVPVNVLSKVTNQETVNQNNPHKSQSVPPPIDITLSASEQEEVYKEMMKHYKPTEKPVLVNDNSNTLIGLTLPVNVLSKTEQNTILNNAAQTVNKIGLDKIHPRSDADETIQVFPNAKPVDITESNSFRTTQPNNLNYDDERQLNWSTYTQPAEEGIENVYTFTQLENLFKKYKKAKQNLVKYYKAQTEKYNNIQDEQEEVNGDDTRQLIWKMPNLQKKQIKIATSKDGLLEWTMPDVTISDQLENEKRILDKINSTIGRPFPSITTPTAEEKAFSFFKTTPTTAKPALSLLSMFKIPTKQPTMLTPADKQSLLENFMNFFTSTTTTTTKKPNYMQVLQENSKVVGSPVNVMWQELVKRFGKAQAEKDSLTSRTSKDDDQQKGSQPNNIQKPQSNEPSPTEIEPNSEFVTWKLPEEFNVVTPSQTEKPYTEQVTQSVQNQAYYPPTTGYYKRPQMYNYETITKPVPIMPQMYFTTPGIYNIPQYPFDQQPFDYYTHKQSQRYYNQPNQMNHYANTNFRSLNTIDPNIRTQNMNNRRRQFSEELIFKPAGSGFDFFIATPSPHRKFKHNVSDRMLSDTAHDTNRKSNSDGIIEKPSSVEILSDQNQYTGDFLAEVEKPNAGRFSREDVESQNEASPKKLEFNLINNTGKLSRKHPIFRVLSDNINKGRAESIVSDAVNFERNVIEPTGVNNHTEDPTLQELIEERLQENTKNVAHSLSTRSINDETQTQPYRPEFHNNRMIPQRIRSKTLEKHAPLRPMLNPYVYMPNFGQPHHGQQSKGFKRGIGGYTKGNRFGEKGDEIIPGKKLVNQKLSELDADNLDDLDEELLLRLNEDDQNNDSIGEKRFYYKNNHDHNHNHLFSNAESKINRFYKNSYGDKNLNFPIQAQPMIHNNPLNFNNGPIVDYMNAPGYINPNNFMYNNGPIYNNDKNLLYGNKPVKNGKKYKKFRTQGKSETLSMLHTEKPKEDDVNLETVEEEGVVLGDAEKYENIPNESSFETSTPSIVHENENQIILSQNQIVSSQQNDNNGNEENVYNKEPVYDSHDDFMNIGPRSQKSSQETNSNNIEPNINEEIIEDDNKVLLANEVANNFVNEEIVNPEITNKLESEIVSPLKTVQTEEVGELPPKNESKPIYLSHKHEIELFKQLEKTLKALGVSHEQNEAPKVNYNPAIEDKELKQKLDDLKHELKSNEYEELKRMLEIRDLSDLSFEDKNFQKKLEQLKARNKVLDLDGKEVHPLEEDKPTKIDSYESTMKSLLKQYAKYLRHHKKPNFSEESLMLNSDSLEDYKRKLMERKWRSKANNHPSSEMEEEIGRILKSAERKLRLKHHHFGSREQDYKSKHAKLKELTSVFEELLSNLDNRKANNGIVKDKAKAEIKKLINLDFSSEKDVRLRSQDRLNKLSPEDIKILSSYYNNMNEHEFDSIYKNPEILKDLNTHRFKAIHPKMFNELHSNEIRPETRRALYHEFLKERYSDKIPSEGLHHFDFDSKLHPQVHKGMQKERIREILKVLHPELFPEEIDHAFLKQKYSEWLKEKHQRKHLPTFEEVTKPYSLKIGNLKSKMDESTTDSVGNQLIEASKTIAQELYKQFDKKIEEMKREGFLGNGEQSVEGKSPLSLKRSAASNDNNANSIHFGKVARTEEGLVFPIPLNQREGKIAHDKTISQFDHARNRGNSPEKINIDLGNQDNAQTQLESSSIDSNGITSNKVKTEETCVKNLQGPTSVINEKAVLKESVIKNENVDKSGILSKQYVEKQEHENTTEIVQQIGNPIIGIPKNHQKTNPGEVLADKNKENNKSIIGIQKKHQKANPGEILTDKNKENIEIQSKKDEFKEEKVETETKPAEKKNEIIRGGDLNINRKTTKDETKEAVEDNQITHEKGDNTSTEKNDINSELNQIKQLEAVTLAKNEQKNESKPGEKKKYGLNLEGNKNVSKTEHSTVGDKVIPISEVKTSETPNSKNEIESKQSGDKRKLKEEKSVLESPIEKSTSDQSSEPKKKSKRKHSQHEDNRDSFSSSEQNSLEDDKPKKQLKHGIAESSISSSEQNSLEDDKPKKKIKQGIAGSSISSSEQNSLKDDKPKNKLKHGIARSNIISSEQNSLEDDKPKNTLKHEITGSSISSSKQMSLEDDKPKKKIKHGKTGRKNTKNARKEKRLDDKPISPNEEGSNSLGASGEDKLPSKERSTESSIKTRSTERTLQGNHHRKHSKKSKGKEKIAIEIVENEEVAKPHKSHAKKIKTHNVDQEVESDVKSTEEEELSKHHRRKIKTHHADKAVKIKQDESEMSSSSSEELPKQKKHHTNRVKTHSSEKVDEVSKPQKSRLKHKKQTEEESENDRRVHKTRRKHKTESKYKTLEETSEENEEKHGVGGVITIHTHKHKNIKENSDKRKHIDFNQSRRKYKKHKSSEDNHSNHKHKHNSETDFNSTYNHEREDDSHDHWRGKHGSSESSERRPKGKHRSIGSNRYQRRN